MKARGAQFLQARRGFTLVELLVAIAISAIVLAVINATFFGALRLRNTTQQRIDEDLELQRALDLLRRDLSGLMLPGGVLSGQFQTSPTSPLTTEAPGDRLSPDLYTTTGSVDGWNPFSEAQLVTYYLVPDASGANAKTLVRVVTRNLLPAQTPTSEEQALLSGIAEASLTYFDGAAWNVSWDSAATSTLPIAIKVQVRLAPSDSSQPAPAPVELVVGVPVVTRASATAAAGVKS